MLVKNHVLAISLQLEIIKSVLTDEQKKNYNSTVDSILNRGSESYLHISESLLLEMDQSEVDQVLKLLKKI